VLILTEKLERGKRGCMWFVKCGLWTEKRLKMTLFRITQFIKKQLASHVPKFFYELHGPEKFSFF
jgi:hypothetical protein